ncbi:MAG: site-2 protease family protein [Caldisericia bacterium]|jgi:Zn-dependent protease|nr:site-2 protease family protein [Caldisericia bacterium]
MLNNLLEILFLLPSIIIAIIFHEVAHGYIAYKLGDETPKEYGRLTLDPTKHIDLFGTILLPVLLLLSSNFKIAFGWAKPVPINFYRFRNIRRDLVFVSIAGPLTNIILAIIFSIIFKLVVLPFPKISTSYISIFVQYSVLINLILAFFNLIPIPPLDGSRILYSIIFKYPQDALKNRNLEIYGSLILIVLLFFGIIGKILSPLIIRVSHFLLW